MSRRGVPILALTTHARHVPAVEREQFAVQLRRSLDLGAFMFETCHRVEAYVAGADAVSRAASLSMPAGGRALEDDAAIRHAIAVAVGSDSVVAGEDQILHQLRAALVVDRAPHTIDPILERLLTSALRAGRRARSWRQGPDRSLATVALAAIESRAGSVEGRTVLVVGAGQMGRLAARAAVHAGARVLIASRSAEHAAQVARAVGGAAIPLDPGTGIAEATGVIVALSGPWPLGAATSRSLLASATVIVDLSVPAAVPADLADRLGTRHVTADDLARTPDLGEMAPDHRLVALIERTTREFQVWLDGRDGRAAAAMLSTRADQAREAELAELWRRLPELDPEARDAIDRMTRHLAERLLREPLERLGRDADGRTESVIREVFAL